MSHVDCRAMSTVDVEQVFPGASSQVCWPSSVVSGCEQVTLSGFVSVFFEKVLKSRVVNLTVWDRNFQVRHKSSGPSDDAVLAPELACLGCPSGFLGLCLGDGIRSA